MKRNRMFVLGLAAALAGLIACSPMGGSASLPGEERPAELPLRKLIEQPLEQLTDTPARPFWDESHRLKIPFTPVKEGALELPVRGATGYASVELPLWLSPEDGEAYYQSLLEPPAPEPSASSSAETGGSTSTQGTEDDAADSSGQPPLEGTAPGDGSTAQDPGTVPSEIPEGDAASSEPAAPPSTPEPQPEEPTPPEPYPGSLEVLSPGTGFTVLQEQGRWWKVRTTRQTGWVEHKYCLINLPDVVPSIVYDSVNGYSACYVSSGREIPGITGEALYTGAVYNPRLGRDEFMMPVLYAMAPHICQAQQSALAEGNTLVFYEGYRPYAAQRAVVKGLTALSKTDPEVKAGISTPPWSISWFIATGYSNHQRGFAMDVGLAKVWSAAAETVGSFSYPRALEYSVYSMPTPIHELSSASAAFTAPVASHSKTAWKKAQMAEGMNTPALALQRYCTGAGLTPLASEWWHFNDLDVRAQVLDNLSVGDYEIRDCFSTAP